LAFGASLLSGFILMIQACVTKAFGGQLSRSPGMEAVLTILFCILPVTANVICQAFPCSTFDAGPDQDPIRVMTADMAISCDDDDRRIFIVLWAWVSLIVYIIGVPALIGYMLYRRRAEIASRETLTGGKALSSLSFLFRNYARDFGWWMPVVDLYRRLALSSLLLLFKGVWCAWWCGRGAGEGEGHTNTMSRPPNIELN